MRLLILRAVVVRRRHKGGLLSSHRMLCSSCFDPGGVITIFELDLAYRQVLTHVSFLGKLEVYKNWLFIFVFFLAWLIIFQEVKFHKIRQLLE